MDISFVPFSELHFPLMSEWLESPHVKKWWGQNIVYTDEIVKEQYTSYTQGHKEINGICKSIHSYIILVEQKPIGYIQAYNAYDFPRSKPLLELPESLAALDIFIGEETYLKKGIGSEAIKKFVEAYLFPYYQYCFVDPEFKNEQAVHAYERAGFKIFKKVDNIFWMMMCRKIIRLSLHDCVALEITFKKSFLKEDTLWVFGSRVDLNKKGGDIDLYIETKEENVSEVIQRKSRFISSLEHKIGEQKIDVVLNMLHFPTRLPIYEVARKEGVRVV